MIGLLARIFAVVLYVGAATFVTATVALILTIWGIPAAALTAFGAFLLLTAAATLWDFGGRRG